MSSVNQQLLSQLIPLAESVGLFQLKHWHQVKQSDIADKGLNQLVSFVDQQSELQLIEACKVMLPNSRFIAEEFHADSTLLEGYTWIIDPLDGTTNFLHGLPVFSISIALWGEGKMQLGLVHCPAMKETFWACTGEGAFCNGEKIAVSDARELKQSLIATGFPYYQFDRVNAFSDLLQHLMKNTHGIRRMGSAAIDLAYTAMGRFDAFYEMDLAPWDVAAGSLIIEEAGGKVSDFNRGNQYLFGKQIIASNATLFEEFSTLVQEKLG